MTRLIAASQDVALRRRTLRQKDADMVISASQALPLAVLAGVLTFWVWCLRDVMRTEESDVRHLPKHVWLVVVAHGSVVGAIVWWLAGRKRP